MKLDPEVKKAIKRKVMEALQTRDDRYVKVTSSYQLSKDELNALSKALTTKGAVHISQEVDEALIGGLILEENGTVIDMSIKGSLNGVINSIKE